MGNAKGKIQKVKLGPEGDSRVKCVPGRKDYWCPKYPCFHAKIEKATNGTKHKTPPTMNQLRPANGVPEESKTSFWMPRNKSRKPNAAHNPNAKKPPKMSW
jgi:hypothetical protein